MCDDNMDQFEDDLITEAEMNALDDRFETALMDWQMKHFGSAVPDAGESLRAHLGEHGVHLVCRVAVEGWRQYLGLRWEP